MKKYYQLIYKEFGRVDDVFNEAGSINIFESEIDAWKEALKDCETDLDVAFAMMRAADGALHVKELTVNEDSILFAPEVDDGVVGD